MSERDWWIIEREEIIIRKYTKINDDNFRDKDINLPPPSPSPSVRNYICILFVHRSMEKINRDVEFN